jgi:hypothetical protein
LLSYAKPTQSGSQTVVRTCPPMLLKLPHRPLLTATLQNLPQPRLFRRGLTLHIPIPLETYPPPPPPHPQVTPVILHLSHLSPVGNFLPLTAHPQQHTWPSEMQQLLGRGHPYRLMQVTRVFCRAFEIGYNCTTVLRDAIAIMIIGTLCPSRHLDISSFLCAHEKRFPTT